VEFLNKLTEYQLKDKLSKTGAAFSVAKHNKHRSEMVIESDAASTFKSNKPGSPHPQQQQQPFAKTGFPISTPQISVHHQ
jgi:hypothetical protein